MFKRLRDRTAIAGFALAILVLGIAAVMSLRSVRQLAETTRSVSRTQQAIRCLEHVLSLLKDAEVGQRGYLLTGDPSFLAPYETATGLLEQEYATLQGLLSSDPQQQRYLQGLEPLIANRLSLLRETIDLYDAQGLAAPQRAVMLNRGKDTMDTIRVTVANMDENERRKLAAAERQARDDVAFSSAIVAGAGGLALLLVSVAAAVGMFNLRQRRLAEQALQRSHDELEQRVASRTHELMLANQQLNDEIARRRQVEAALIRSEQDYRELFEKAHDAILVIDIDNSQVLDVNQEACQLYGYARDEFIGLPTATISPDTAARVAQLVISPQDRYEFQDVQHFDRHGRSLFMDVRGSLVTYHNRRALLKIMRDTSEDKRRQRELAAIAAIAAALRTSFTPEYVLALILDQVVDMFHADAAVVVLSDRATGGLVIELGRGAWDGLAGTRIAPRNDAAADEQAPAGNGDARASLADPALRPFLRYLSGVRAIAASPLVAQDITVGALAIGRMQEIDGQEMRMLSAMANIAAGAIYHSTLYRRIQVQADRLQQIMESIADGLLLLDDAGQVIQANAAAQDYLPVLQAVYDGKRLLELGGRPLDVLLSSPPSEAGYHEIVITQPEHRVFEVSARSGKPREQSRSRVLVLRDVTESRNVQARVQQQERLAAVGQMAAGIAHDFNNVLSVVLLYGDLVRQSTNLDDKDRRRLATIHEQAQRATELVSQVLDFSRSSVMERSPADLVPFLNELVGLLTRTLPENLTFDFEHDVETCIVNVDLTRMQQALMNLAINARDAMPNGGSLVFRLGTFAVTDDQRPPVGGMTAGRWAELAVADDGSGIPAAVLPRIFDPFFTTKPPGKGTGLGLSQVYGIVKQHDGHIAVASESGEGTTFTIFLPLWEHAVVPAELSDMPVSSAGTERILVVEDNDATRTALVDILELQGYQVMTAADGREAVELYRLHAGEIGLVLSDMLMPGMGGLKLYQALREVDPDLKMIVMTGYPLEQGGKQLLEQGIVDWIQKPFAAERIVQTIRAALDRPAQA